MSDVTFSDHFAVIFHYSFLKAASVIYYLLTPYNHTPSYRFFLWVALSDGGPLSVTHTQFFFWFPPPPPHVLKWNSP